MSYATAGVSKGVAAAVQLLALPVVALSLGAERFGALLVLGAAGVLCCLPARAIPPAASVAIARARGLNDRERAEAEVWSGGLISMGLGVVAVAAVAVVALFLDPRLLLGRGAAPILAEARGGIAALAALVFATYFFAWVEGVRMGYEENHLNNLFSLLGSVIALIGIGLAWAFAPTIPAYFLAISVTYPLMQGLNLAFMPKERRSRAGLRRLDASIVKGTARRAFDWSVAQVGVALHLQGSVYIAAQLFGLAAGALVGGMVRLLQIAQNLLLALLNPILPTLSHAAAKGDRAWVARTGRRVALLLFAVLAALSGAIALLGDRIVDVWLDLDAPADLGLFGALAAMALFSAAAQLGYLLLLALGDGRRPSQCLFWAGVAGVVAGLVLAPSFRLPGLLWGQAAMMFLVGFAPVTLRLVRQLGPPHERA